MLTDAHCHPFDLCEVFPQAEDERRQLGVTAAASACDLKEFTHNEDLARKAADGNASALLPCFAVHPQLPAVKSGIWNEGLETLEELASQGRLSAIGETGFDLYNAEYRATEKIQDELFAAHIETALRYDLPVVLHARRAMHKIFTDVKTLAKCRAVVFHSWSGTYEEGQSLLRRGVNAYFSFGNAIMLNHKQAIQCCALFPAQRLLTETDAPYQPLKDKSFSHWADLPLIIETAAALRRTAQNDNAGAKELEAVIEKNFFDAFVV